MRKEKQNYVCCEVNYVEKYIKWLEIDNVNFGVWVLNFVCFVLFLNFAVVVVFCFFESGSHLIAQAGLIFVVVLLL